MIGNISLFVFALALVSPTLAWQDRAANPPAENRSTIGYPQQIRNLVIPGSPIEAKPIEDRDQPVIVRILAMYPHGTDYRYDIEFRVLEAGQFNLADQLKRINPSEADPIAEIPVAIDSLLPGGQVEPSPLRAVPSRYWSFYFPLIVLGAILWTIGLLLILFYGRPRKAQPIKQAKPITVAERLRPLIAAAMAGTISTEQQAELERVLGSYWSQKMSWQNLTASQIRQQLREHPEASQLLNQIDHWLHRPKTADWSSESDLKEILQPYVSEP